MRPPTKTVILRAGLIALFSAALIQSDQTTQPGSLTVTIRDAGTGQPTPVRVTLADSNGNKSRIEGALAVSDSAFGVPKEAIGVLYGQQDRAQGYLLQRDGSFYVDGKFNVQLPPG